MEGKYRENKYIDEKTREWLDEYYKTNWANEVGYKPLPFQWQFHGGIGVKFIEGQIASGKTHACVMEAYRWATKNDKSLTVMVCDVYINTFELAVHLYGDKVKSVSRFTSEVEFPNGSKILFRQAYDPLPLAGLAIDCLILDAIQEVDKYMSLLVLNRPLKPKKTLVTKRT